MVVCVLKSSLSSLPTVGMFDEKPDAESSGNKGVNKVNGRPFDTLLFDRKGASRASLRSYIKSKCKGEVYQKYQKYPMYRGEEYKSKRTRTDMMKVFS